MSPGLLRRARYWYGAVGIITGVARVPLFNEFGYRQGTEVIGTTVIRGMSTLIPGSGTPMTGIY